MRSSSVRAAIAACVWLAAGAGATPLRMNYCVADIGGGLFEYQVELILDNNDVSWAPGHGFGWIVFGDIVGTQPPLPPAVSPIADFAIDGTSLPIGPFTKLTGTGGLHNGPTLGPVTNPVPTLWIPATIGDKLEWKGTSAANLGQGQMLWSCLQSGGGAGPAEFIVGHLVPCGGTCYPDCNLDGSLTVADFGCYQTAFVAGLPYADCNGDLALTVADFGCYQTKFVAGCP